MQLALSCTEKQAEQAMSDRASEKHSFMAFALVFPAGSCFDFLPQLPFMMGCVQDISAEMNSFFLKFHLVMVSNHSNRSLRHL